MSLVNFRFCHIFGCVVSSWSKFCYSDDISSLLFSYFVLLNRVLWYFVLEFRARDPGVFGPDVNLHFTVGTLEALFGSKFRILARFLMSYLHIFSFLFICESFVHMLCREQVSFHLILSFRPYVVIFTLDCYCFIWYCYLLFFAIVDAAFSVFAIFTLCRCICDSLVSISVLTHLFWHLNASDFVFLVYP